VLAAKVYRETVIAISSNNESNRRPKNLSKAALNDPTHTAVEYTACATTDYPAQQSQAGGIRCIRDRQTPRTSFDAAEKLKQKCVERTENNETKNNNKQRAKANENLSYC